MELVRTIDGIDYINDSKATTAEAGRWARESVDKPVIMICGGRDKNTDFSGLVEIVKNKVKKMIVIGEAREKLSKVFSNVVDVATCDTLTDAVTNAFNLAEEGDSILFSPMCASFDMFKNFEERGKVFKEIINSF